MFQILCCPIFLIVAENIILFVHDTILGRSLIIIIIIMWVRKIYVILSVPGGFYNIYLPIIINNSGVVFFP